MIVTLAKQPGIDYTTYFKSYNVKLNGTTVGYLFADLSGKWAVTDVWNAPVAQSSTIRAAFRKAARHFGRGQ